MDWHFCQHLVQEMIILFSFSRRSAMHGGQCMGGDSATVRTMCSTSHVPQRAMAEADGERPAVQKAQSVLGGLAAGDPAALATDGGTGGGAQAARACWLEPEGTGQRGP